MLVLLNIFDYGKTNNSQLNLTGNFSDLVCVLLFAEEEEQSR